EPEGQTRKRHNDAEGRDRDHQRAIQPGEVAARRRRSARKTGTRRRSPVEDLTRERAGPREPAQGRTGTTVSQFKVSQSATQRHDFTFTAVTGAREIETRSG